MENKETYLKKIGGNIKEIRKAKKQEVKEAAKGMNISVQALGALENGKVDFNISRLFDLAHYYQVEITEIFKISEGDSFNFYSQNNSGGYHIQKVGELNISDEELRNYIKSDVENLKSKITFLENAINK